MKPDDITCVCEWMVVGCPSTSLAWNQAAAAAAAVTRMKGDRPREQDGELVRKEANGRGSWIRIVTVPHTYENHAAFQGDEHKTTVKNSLNLHEKDTHAK
jgi:hypothetical protein